MSILSQLSSQAGDRTEASNRRVVIQCLDNPDLLADIADGLKHRDAAVVGDCAEVMTKVAEDHPEWVAPFAEELTSLFIHKNTRVRWEAMHALSLISTLTPATIEAQLPRLDEILHRDASVIVRDYATGTIATYAATSETAADRAYPLLKEMLTLWNGKQAGHALQGMIHIARLLPARHTELLVIAEEFTHVESGVVRKAARRLLNALGS